MYTGCILFWKLKTCWKPETGNPVFFFFQSVIASFASFRYWTCCTLVAVANIHYILFKKLCVREKCFIKVTKYHTSKNILLTAELYVFGRSKKHLQLIKNLTENIQHYFSMGHGAVLGNCLLKRATEDWANTRSGYYNSLARSIWQFKGLKGSSVMCAMNLFIKDSAEVCSLLLICLGCWTWSEKDSPESRSYVRPRERRWCGRL